MVVKIEICAYDVKVFRKSSVFRIWEYQSGFSTFGRFRYLSFLIGPLVIFLNMVRYSTEPLLLVLYENFVEQPHRYLGK